MSELVWATSDTWVTELVCLHKGEPWAADDPIVRRFPKSFTNVPPGDAVKNGGVVIFGMDGEPIVTPAPESKATRRAS